MISYCVTVYNEIEYIKHLIENLSVSKNIDEEIIVVQTHRSSEEINEEWYKNINQYLKSKNLIEYNYKFDNKFGKLKNFMNSLATKEYILNLDADENLNPKAFPIFRQILKETNLDLYLLSRINTVEGITEEDIKQWSWNVNSKGWINWPDFQPRLYKNNRIIAWYGDVHESLGGYKNYGTIENETLSILHHKEISRQRLQNKLYNQIQQERVG